MPSDEYAKYAQEMREWLNTQPHLPKNISDNMLCRFAQSCYYDMDRAKRTADNFFTLRREYSQMFTDRDPKSPHMQNIMNIVKIARYEISEKRKLWFYQLSGHRTFDMVADAKLNFLVDDCWFLENEEKFYENDIYYVMDLKDMPLSFIWKVKMSVVKAYSKYQREATPIRLKEIHCVNASPVIDKLFSFIKPFLSKEVSDSIYIHEENSDSLLKYFTKEELPADFGGSRPTMDTLMAETMKLIEEKRDTVMNNNFWMAN